MYKNVTESRLNPMEYIFVKVTISGQNDPEGGNFVMHTTRVALSRVENCTGFPKYTCKAYKKIV